MGAVADLANRMRRLSTELAPRLSKVAASEVQSFLQRQAAAGVTPSGDAWEPKNDGGRALPKAADHVHVEGRGTTLFVTVDVPYTFHKAKRRMMPTGKEPGVRASINRAFERVLKEVGFR